jgi:hypothetical protein
MTHGKDSQTLKPQNVLSIATTAFSIETTRVDGARSYKEAREKDHRADIHFANDAAAWFGWLGGLWNISCLLIR